MDPILTELWNAAKQAGPFASLILLCLWWLERGDRKIAQDNEREANRRAADGLNNAANAIGDLRVYLGLNRQDRRSAE